MKNIFPNMSILTFLTQKKESDKSEMLLFICVKPVPDLYLNPKLFWFPEKGAKGKAKLVWENLSIKQWVACGTDTQILSLFDEILSSNKIVIGNKEIELSIPKHKLIKHEESILKNRREITSDNLIIDEVSLLPLQFFQKENLKMLSGYSKGNDDIKPIEPLGILEDNFIFNNLRQDIIGIKEYRRPYLTFRGVRKTSKKETGPKEVVGFYQENFDDSLAYTVGIISKENIDLGKSDISKSTGLFKVALTEPTHDGSVQIFLNDKEEITVEFTLLKDIQFNVNPSSTSFKDAYGRSFIIVKKEKESKTISNFTWQKNIYADKKEANQKLSDKFKDLLDYLSPDVLIADPYFIGGISKNEITEQYELTDCQISFVNAIFHSAIDSGLKKINFLGFNHRANNHFDKDDASEGSKSIQRFERYESMFRGFIKANDLKSFFPKGSIAFSNAKQDFHNRYWLSVKTEDGKSVISKCVIITNSIGNINEVDIMVVTDEDQLKQIARKYKLLYSDSEIQLTI